MSDVIDDENIWIPRQQTTNRVRGNKKKTDDVEDDDIVFQFANGDMGALNRYLHGGRVLPLTSDAYFQRVGILDQDKLTAKIKAQIDLTVETFKTVRISHHSWLLPWSRPSLSP